MNRLPPRLAVAAAFLSIGASAVLPAPAEAQLRRPGLVSVDREDRDASRLPREKGAVYLEGMVREEIVVRIAKPAAVYASLSGERWLGNLVPERNGVLLAVSDRAYRVRAQAQQGQVAGWVAKSAVEGITPEFEEALARYHERHEMVRELIREKQIALGMTVAEVVESIGPPDQRSSKVTSAGRSDLLEFVSYQRVPQTVMSYDFYGRPVPTTRYVEVESGRLTVEFINDAVVSIEESEGLNFARGGVLPAVPAPVYLR